MKVAVIGIGIVGKLHLDLLLDSGRNVVAICDVDPLKCAPYLQLTAYTDYREMLDKEQLDIVHICTPHYLHTEMILYALERGVNVLCEKPLCITEEDIPKILEAEEKSSAQLGVCFQNRYLPRNAYLKEFLKEEKVLSAVATLAWDRGESYYRSASWRGTKEKEGGGVLINQAIHTIDLLTWLIGMPKYVTASVSNLTLQNVIDVEDTASLICTDGAEFTLLATNGSCKWFPLEVRILTENHFIRLFDDELEIDGKIFNFENTGEYFGKACYGWGHAPLFDDFYRCIEMGTLFKLNGREGAKALKIVLSAYASNGKKVRVEE